MIPMPRRRRTATRSRRPAATEGDVAEGTRTDLLGNTLVLVAHDANAAPVDPLPIHRNASR